MPQNGIFLLFLAVLFLFSTQILAEESDTYLHLKPNNNVNKNKDLGDFSVSYFGESSNISIINFAGNYDKNVNGSVNVEARQAVTQEFYRVQPDQYDFLVIFTKFPVDSGDAAAFNISYENDVEGIGLPLFDNSLDMRSERLQATIDMTELSDWEFNPGNIQFNFTTGVLLHEMMHRWGVRAKFQDKSGLISDLTLGRDGAHWNYFLNSNASVMYGSLWNDLGGNQFQTTAVRNSLSPLDLYLMGFREPSSVPDFFYIENGTPGNRYNITTVPLTGIT